MKQIQINGIANVTISKEEFEEFFKRWIDSNGWSFNGYISNKNHNTSIYSWGEEDDLVLAEVVLKHMREGKSLKSAYEIAGEKLNRSSSACGQRWNSFTKLKYQTAIQIAKAQAEKRKSMKG
jgi:hypothetical protein